MTRNAIQFLLDGQIQSLAGFAPERTMLDWLRDDLGRVSISQECDQGGCGVCTLTVARLEEGRVIIRPVNACLQLLGTLDGAALFTAEDRAFERADEALAIALRTLEDGEDVAIQHADGVFHAPATLASLCKLLITYPDTTIVAGGTDVGLWVTRQSRRLPRAAWLGRVKELREIRQNDAGLYLGAAVSLADAQPVLTQLYPHLDELFHAIAPEPVRAAGTLGGNIANGSPIGDIAPTLIAADASVHLRFGDKRRVIKFEDFFIADGLQDRENGELVLGVGIPIPPEGSHCRAYKLGKAREQGAIFVLGAFRITLSAGVVTDARLVYEGISGIPIRAKTAEAELLGKRWNDCHVRNAMTALGQDFAAASMSSALRDATEAAAGLLLRFFSETSGVAIK